MKKRGTYFLWIFIKLAIVGCFAFILQQTNEAFPYLGTDGAFVITPAPIVQALSVVLFFGTIFAPPKKARILRIAILVACVICGGHRLVVDPPVGKIEDFYLLLRVQSVPMVRSDDWTLNVRESALGLTVLGASAGQPIFIWSPIIFGLDRNEIAKLTV